MACNSCNSCNSCGNVQGITFPDFVANSCCNPCCENAVAGQSTGGCGCGCGCGNVGGTSCGCNRCGCNSCSSCGCGSSGNLCDSCPWLPGCNTRD
ncbi:MAG: hypothetical protein IJO88_03035 [Oscillospiraceae bacterium]|nr:hypothetical protein [Oscillospiraceae bacterium]